RRTDGACVSRGAGRPARTLSNVEGKPDAPSQPADVTCLHSTQTNRSEPTMYVSGMPGAQSCKCSCEVTFSQPKHSFVIMVATPFWNGGTSGTPEAIWSTTNVDLPRPSVRCAPPPFSDRRAPESAFDSTFWRKNDTEQHSFVPAYLPGSADMRTTIRPDGIVDLVIGNRRSFAIHFDFVMIADHAALRRATVHEVTAGAFAVVSVDL